MRKGGEKEREREKGERENAFLLKNPFKAIVWVSEGRKKGGEKNRTR